MTIRDRLQQCREYIRSRGWEFAPGLVENFYLSLMCRPFVILGGYDGVEPSLLSRLFAESLGATEENGRYLQLTVRPDWMDSSDMFGCLDLYGHFQPGVILELLKKAQNDPEKPYFLCLDRLLLDRAGYYLGEILSSVESLGSEAPKPLVTLAYYGRDEDAKARYGVIPALSNLYIICTVNMNEASKPLDQRLLDRVHILEYDDRAVRQCPAAGGTAPAEADNAFLQTRYYRLEQCPMEQRQTYFAIFDPLNAVLSRGKTYMGFRLRNDAIMYLMHNRATGVLPEEAALDHQIAVKVLTRIQGGSKLVRPMLEMLLADYGNYPETAAKLRKMLAQCENEGYTSFWG